MNRSSLSFLSGFLCLLAGIVLSSCFPLAAGPSARYGGSMVYDAGDQTMILFGGRGKSLLGERCLNDVWSFSPASLSWTRIKTGNPPPPRLSPGMVYLPDLHQILMFGGLGDQTRFGDTWILDLATSTWQELALQPSPSPRSDMGLAYDPANQAVLLSGGYCLESQRLECGETWKLDLREWQWQKLELESSPPVTYGLRLVYDGDSGQFYQWGGHMLSVSEGNIRSGGYSDTVWTFNFLDQQWQVLPGAGSVPAARYWHQLAVDPGSSRLILFGGDGGRGYLEDTWVYAIDDNRWQLLHSGDSPAPRTNPCLAYDPLGKQMVLFGGLGEEFKVLGDAWLFSTASGQWSGVKR